MPFLIFFPQEVIEVWSLILLYFSSILFFFPSFFLVEWYQCSFTQTLSSVFWLLVSLYRYSSKRFVSSCDKLSFPSNDESSCFRSYNVWYQGIRCMYHCVAFFSTDGLTSDVYIGGSFRFSRIVLGNFLHHRRPRHSLRSIAPSAILRPTVFLLEVLPSAGILLLWSTRTWFANSSGPGGLQTLISTRIASDVELRYYLDQVSTPCSLDW